MRPLHALGLVIGLVLLAAAGAGVAMLLLSTIGGTRDDDPVGRLRPVVPGLSVTTVTIPLPSVPTGTETTRTERDHDKDD